MKDFDTKWEKLVALARQAPEPAGEEAPYGFATRMAARGLDATRTGNPVALLEKLALRGLIAAGALGVASAAYGFAAFDGTAEDDLALAYADPLAEILDISS